MIRIDVRCQECHRVLDEPPDAPPVQRQPCPECGSLARERTVLMVPGEAAPPPRSADRAWLDFGAALATAASALEMSLKEDQLTPKQRAHAEETWLNVLKALQEYREANRILER